MAAINNGIVTSFGNTPQAVDDVFNAAALGVGPSGAYVPILIDVMANDKAGGAKTLYSLDNGTSAGGIRPTDLLTQDLARTEAASTDTSANGARIWITSDGKVGYDASTLSPAALSQLQGLGAGQFFTDTFTYAIRMANGTLSWATVQVKIPGVNDAATISGTSTGNTVEDTAGQLHAEGTLTVSDMDAGQNVFQAPAPASLNGTYGTFTFNALTGQWTYDLDHTKADPLAGGQVVHDTLIVTSLDGTASRTIDITVTGTNDAAVLSADVRNLTETNSATDISASGTLSNDDVDSPETFVAQTDADGTYGSFSINAAGAWTYTADDAHNEFVDGEVYTDTFTVESADGTETTVTINITGTNDAAILDLDASASGTGYVATSAGGVATAIVDADITITDADNTQLTSATITVTNHKTGDLLSIAGSLPAGITASSYNSSTGVLTLSGIGTLAQYQAVLQQLRFSNGETHPDITDRDITVTVNDGIASSNIAHSIISVTAPNEAPIATDDSFSATENAISGATSSAAPLAIGNVLTQATADSDPDGDALSVTTVTSVSVTETDAQLSTPVISVETAGAGEAARYQITTTTGTAHLAVMATGAVNLWTSSGDAFQGLGTGESATLSFTYEISDGHGGSDTANAQITINGSNDNPTAANVVQAAADTLAINAGTVVASGNLVTASAAADPDGDTPLTISSIQGPADGSAITVTAGGVVAHGTYGDLTVSSGGTYSYTAKPAFDALQTGNNPTEAFTFVVSDGHGGTTTQTLTFNISGANDAPTGLDFILASGGSSADNGTSLNAHGLIGTFVATGDPDGGAFTYTLSATGGLYGMDAVDGNATSNTTGNFYVGNSNVVAGSDTSFTVSVGGATFDAHVVVFGTGDDPFTGSGTVVDIVYGHNGQDNLNGAGGSDALIGGANTDVLIGGAGNDQMAGGNGNDTYVFASSGSGNDRIDETGGNGTDAAQITTAAGGATVFTTLGVERVGNDMLITYNDSSITVTGQYAGGETVESVVFTNGGTFLGYQLGTTAYALSADGTSPLAGTNSLDVVASSSTGETLTGANGNDLLFGNGGIDTISGGNNNDLLVGGAGNDILNGDADNDTLVGGDGADALNGGTGADTFVYTAISDSLVGAGNRDVVTGFLVGTDKLRLIEIDANTALAGDQAFAFVAAQNAGVVANSVTWHQSGGNTYVHGDVNGDGAADFEIELLGTHNLTSSEFNL